VSDGRYRNERIRVAVGRLSEYDTPSPSTTEPKVCSS
jgi:hypothetical protein